MRMDERIHIAIQTGKTSWGAHQSGQIELPHLTLPIQYDEREAPYVPGDKTLVSLADEGEVCVCAYAESQPGSSLAGIGVDLASPEDFERPGAERFAELIFSPRERELAERMCAKPNMRLAFAYAVLFGAKEAAFKATARPLRMWYQFHDDPLEFEVRDFGSQDLGVVRGNLRRGAAQRALDRMGIYRIETTYAKLEGMALVTAQARCNAPSVPM